MKKLLLMSALLAMVLSVWGCGGPPTPGSMMAKELEGAPDWAVKGHGDDKAKVYGVGSVTGTANVALARSTAEARGRTAIARSLQIKVKSMLKDYQASTTGGEEYNKAAYDEQYIEDTSKQITDLTLSGTIREDTWIAKTGTYYVLMALDVKHFKDAVGSMKTLSEDIRAAVQERADHAFADLDASTE
jgi:LPP20 lipoprotein